MSWIRGEQRPWAIIHSQILNNFELKLSSAPTSSFPGLAACCLWDILSYRFTFELNHPRIILVLFG